jgi:hypothetical protein
LVGKDKYGWTALMMAEGEKQDVVAELLREVAAKAKAGPLLLAAGAT